MLERSWTVWMFSYLAEGNISIKNDALDFSPFVPQSALTTT